MIYTYRTAILFILLSAALVLIACGGSGGNATLADVVEQVSGQAAAGTESSAAGAPDAAKATVTARSLRVRGEPSPNGEVVGGIKEGEVYDVVGLSSDGEWVQLAVPAIPGGSGWVSANFVEVQGAITNATVTTVTPAASGSTSAGGPTATPGSLNLIAAAPGTATVTTEGVRLRVRAQPAADAEIVGYVYDGEIFPVVETSADGEWTQIGGRPGTDNVNGGWVASEYLVLN